MAQKDDFDELRKDKDSEEFFERSLTVIRSLLAPDERSEAKRDMLSSSVRVAAEIETEHSEASRQMLERL